MEQNKTELNEVNVQQEDSNFATQEISQYSVNSEPTRKGFGKKHWAVASCTAMALLVSTGIVWASADSKTQEPIRTNNYMGVSNMSTNANLSKESAASGSMQMMVKNENGVISHSTDGGKTWVDGAPEGTTINHDGSVTSIMGEPPTGGGQGMLVQNENGVMRHSTDGGKTWVDGAPEGAKTIQNPDGSGTTTVGEPPMGKADGGILIQNENGVMKHSTDGGKTWVDGAPEGATFNTNPDGTTSTIGIPPRPSDLPAIPEGASSLAIKNENGVVSYSTDGGKTWSAEAPAGVNIAKDGDKVTATHEKKSDTSY